jgi:hypothetical protein
LILYVNAFGGGGANIVGHRNHRRRKHLHGR